jgi:NACHT conflict system protein
MPKLTPKLEPQKPVNFLLKPLTADFKELFKALGKGVVHAVTGKWDELAKDTVEALAAVGLTTEPGELATLLIRRSAIRALFELVGQSTSQIPASTNIDVSTLAEQLDFTIVSNETYIDRKFLDRPADLPFIGAIRMLLEQWLAALQVPKSSGSAIAGRLPSYFVYALNQEWRSNVQAYRPLLDAIDTPFTKAGDREWAWHAYSALLQLRVEESVFDEPFSLAQLFIPVNAYYLRDDAKNSTDEMVRTVKSRQRVVVALQQEIEHWLDKATPRTPYAY